MTVLKIPTLFEENGSIPDFLKQCPGSRAAENFLEELRSTRKIAEGIASALDERDEEDIVTAYCECDAALARVGASMDEAVVVIEFLEEQRYVKLYFEVDFDQRTGAINSVTASPLKATLPTVKLY